MKETQAKAWAQTSLINLGYVIQGSMEVIRAMPWSQVSRFSTSRGYVYFKQMAPQFAVEPLVLSFLAQRYFYCIPPLLASNAELRCFLMPDVGTRLREKLKMNYQIEIATKVLTTYADIQLNTMKDIAGILSLGVKDWRLKRLPDIYLQLLAQEELLRTDGLTQDELRTIQHLYSRFVENCEQLAQLGIPETVEHGDFQDNNILINDKKDIIINDWGDTNITHPFFSLGSWLDSARRHHGLQKNSAQYKALVNAYLEKWQQYALIDELHNAFLVAERLRPVLFSINFQRVTTCPGMEALGEFKGYIATALREFIDLHR